MAETVQARPLWQEIAQGERGRTAVDGKEPHLWAEPASLQEAAEVLRGAADQKLAVIPRGGGTRMGLGNVPRAADLVLSTRGLNRVLDYTPADLTVTVEAGMGFADLQEMLHRERQFLALDPPADQHSTVGGVIMANASGPRRLRYGAARDLVIGVRVAQTDGNVTKAGAKVVKNVAGYDLNKLYVGSLGTLVVLGEVSFKLTPLPEMYRTLVCTLPTVEAAMTVVSRTLRSPLSPTALEILNAPASAALPGLTSYGQGGVVLVAEVDGFPKGVARGLHDLEAFARDAGASAISALPEDQAEHLWDDVRNAATRFNGQGAALALKIAVPVAAVTALISAVERARLADSVPAVVSHAGSGIVFVYTDGQGDDAMLAPEIMGLRAAAVEAGGSLVIERCTPELKDRLDVWGEVGPALRVMRTLKELFDPHSILNPGRFVGGI